MVVHHAWQYSGRPRAVLGVWWDELSLGVALFFCLSGFLVYAPWARGRPPRVGRFYVLRAVRILPLYYLTLVVAVAVLYGTGHWRLVDDWRLVGFALLLQNYDPSMAGMLNPPTWSLAVEMSFYVVVPLIGWCGIRAGRQALMLMVLIVGGIAWAALTTPPPVVRQALPDVVGLFCVGMIARVLVEGREVPRALGRALLVGGAALVWAHATGRLGAPLHGALRDLPAGVGFAAICVACAAPASAPRLLGCRPLAYLGTLSYGIYLWHYPILLGLQAHHLLPEDDVVATSALVGLPAVAAAAVTWHVIERPALDATRRWLDRRTSSDGGARGRVPGGVPLPA